MNYREALSLVEEIYHEIESHGGDVMGNGISNTQNVEKITVSFSVAEDKQYVATKRIGEHLKEKYDGSVYYHKYWESPGFKSHSQASLEVEV